jgi:hypothetical protein
MKPIFKLFLVALIRSLLATVGAVIIERWVKKH